MTLKSSDLLVTIEKQARTIEMVNLDLIDQNPIQPPGRADVGVEALSQDILTSMFLVPVVVVRKRTRYTMIDGHRRLSAATRLHLQKIPALVMDTEIAATLLFLILNRSMKNVNAAQLYYAWAHEDLEDQQRFLEHIPVPTQNNIKRMIEIFGRTDAVKLADGKISPHISKFVLDTVNILLAHHVTPLPKGQIGRWLIGHQQVGVVNRLRRDPNLRKKQADLLRESILADRPYGKANIRANLGGNANRLANTITNLTIQAENLQGAESRISDVDVALEMTEFTRNSVMVQAGVAMLAQANTLPQLALTLIGG